jgi:cell wall assembly regulator SMI1
MRTLIIQDDAETRTVNYSSLTDGDIDQRIHEYESKYGRTYQEFYRSFDCDEADMDELTDLLDWEQLVEEKKTRMEKARKSAAFH